MAPQWMARVPPPPPRRRRAVRCVEQRDHAGQERQDARERLEGKATEVMEVFPSRPSCPSCLLRLTLLHEPERANHRAAAGHWQEIADHGERLRFGAAIRFHERTRGGAETGASNGIG